MTENVKATALRRALRSAEKCAACLEQADTPEILRRKHRQALVAIRALHSDRIGKADA